MTQNPGQWGPQGGYPPQGPQGPGPQGPGPQGPGPQGQGPQGPYQQPQPGLYPQQPGQPGGYNPQGAYNPQAGGYPPQPGVYGQPAGPGYGPPPGPGGYGQPPGPGGYGPQGPGPGRGPGAPAKKSPVLIIGIVVAAVVLLAAIGGIFLALNRGGSDTPSSTITPGPVTPPPANPSPTPAGPSTEPPSGPASTPSSEPPTPSGDSIPLGNGISLIPASGWRPENTTNNLAVLSRGGQEVFIGQVISVNQGSDPKAVVDGYHKQLAQKLGNVETGQTKDTDVGASNLKAAHGAMAGTMSTGQGSVVVITESIASVRTDGVTVIATIRYFKQSDPEMLKRDYRTMASSMLTTQAQG